MQFTVFLNYIHHSISDLGRYVAVGFLVVRMKRVITNENVCPKIGRKNDQSVGEVNFVALSIR